MHMPIKRKIQQFKQAVKANAFAGATHPDERPALQDQEDRTEKALIACVSKIYDENVHLKEQIKNGAK